MYSPHPYPCIQVYLGPSIHKNNAATCCNPSSSFLSFIFLSIHFILEHKSYGIWHAAMRSLQPEHVTNVPPPRPFNQHIIHVLDGWKRSKRSENPYCDPIYGKVLSVHYAGRIIIPCIMMASRVQYLTVLGTKKKKKSYSPIHSFFEHFTHAFELIWILCFFFFGTQARASHQDIKKWNDLE